MKQPPKIAEIYSQTMSKIKLMSEAEKINFLENQLSNQKSLYKACYLASETSQDRPWKKKK